MTAQLHRFLLLCAFSLFIPSASRAGDDAPPLHSVPPSQLDTTKIYPIDEIVVTGTRLETLQSTGPSPVSVRSRSDLDIFPGSLVAAGIADLPGLVVKSYGGAGAVQNVALRGMSAEHTLVLVDGVRLNSFQNGITDFSLLPRMVFDRIEVARGGSSSAYGADAIGGVVNLLPVQSSSELHARLSSSLGSNGFSAVEAKAVGGWEGGSVAAGIRRERGKGDYEFEFSNGLATTTARRSGSDFTMTSASLSAREEIGEDASISLFGFHTNADRGSPGPMTDPEETGKARLADKLTRLQSGLAWGVSHDVQVRANVSWQYQDEHYDDPGVLLGGIPLTSRYVNRSYSVSPEVRYGPSQAVAITGGFEYAYAGLQSDEVHDAQRWQRSVFVSSQITLPLPFDLPYEVLLFPLVRYDGFSDIDGDVSPRLGLNIGILRDPDLRVRASYGKSFRAPTFNDLYWNIGGNPDLTPERSLSFDAGIVASMHVWGTVTAGVTYFAIDTRDRIVWLPASVTLWSPRNIARTTSRGIEAELQWKGFDGALALSCNSTWTTATKESEDYPGDPTMGKELIYVPRQTFNVVLTVHANPVTAVVEHCWSSYRYTTEINDRFLPSFGVTSASIRYSLPFSDPGVWIGVEGMNLFGTSYQSIALYPMPLREVRATVGVDL